MLNWLINILFIVLVGFCSAQKPMVQIIIDPKTPLVGEEITVTIKTNIQGDLDVDLPPAFVQGYNIMNGMEQEMDYNTGKSITYYYHSMNGTLGKEGMFVFGPAFVKKGSKVYKSNSVTVKIEKAISCFSGDFSAKQLKKPAFGIIEKSKSKIYEGEPVVISAKVYSHFSPTHYEDYQKLEMDCGIDKHELGNSRKPSTQEVNIRGILLNYFEVDKQVVFPSKVGKVTINPFKMNLMAGLEGFTVISSAANIEVLPLPSNAPKDFIGGVGKFNLTRSIGKKNFVQGDFMTITVVISGEGNLHNINNPKLNLPKGMIEYGDPNIEEDYTFGLSGAQGKITYKYNVQLMNNGNAKIPELSISYFDIIKQQYITLFEKEQEIFVDRNEKHSISKISDETSTKKDETIAVTPLRSFLKASESDSFIASPLFLISVISPICFVFLFLFYKRKKKDHSDEISKQINLHKNKKEAWDELAMAEYAIQNGKPDDFYISIQRSLVLVCQSVLKNRTSNSINKEDLIDELISENVSNETIEELKSIFKLCEEARYGLGIDNSTQESILFSTRNLMNKLIEK